MLKDILTKKKLLFDHDTPEDFVRSLWQKQPRVSFTWIMYRALLLVYMTVCDIILCVNPSPGYVCQKNMIYFTHWAYNIQILAFAFGFGISVGRYVKEKKNPELPAMEKMPVLYKVMWCTYTIAAPCAFGVSVMFWVFIFDPDDYENLVYTVILHVINSVTIVFDFFISAIPFRFLHVYCPLLFAIVYIIFTSIYQMSGGTGNKGSIPIYKILDWREPQKATEISAISLVALLVMHCSLCVLNLLKQYLKRVKDRGIGRGKSTITP